MSYRMLGPAVTLLALILVSPSLVIAQTKYPVEVSHTGNDRVGSLYAFELREAIRGSHGMQLLSDGPSYEPRIKVVLVTIDTDSGDRGISSAIAITILYDSLEVPLGGAHMLTVVQVCGRDRAASCARDLLSTIDSQVSRLRERSQSLWKTLFRQR
ncbi:hypothetical protein [Pelomicrobium methylotrophicum]|uniref:Uncharacterized protein n=1 Tax=Pelomicrobium methylotrophicum TaxID=2602750 RepID=A0A5C7EQ52_9PROT|nr:hypothetical protein [Pelomicrobium methylotrophicum]TXF13712.1 hypothetical protein FR698_00970 [Pelomicrobium methylotrophicum]